MYRVYGGGYWRVGVRTRALCFPSRAYATRRLETPPARNPIIRLYQIHPTDGLNIGQVKLNLAKLGSKDPGPLYSALVHCPWDSVNL